MRVLAVFCAIVLFGDCAATASRASEAVSCQLKQFASTDFTVNASNDIVFPITIGETSTYAVLNLGSAFNSIAPSAVDTLHLTKRRLPTGSANAAVSIGTRRITEVTNGVPVSMGQVRINGVEFLLTTEIEGEAPRATTRIGMSAFSGVDLELDFANRKLNLFSQEHCAGAVVYWSDSFAAVPIRRGPAGGSYLVMELEGRRIETSISTGSEVTTLEATAAKMLFDIDPGKRGAATNTTRSNGTAQATQRFMDLTTNGLAVMNAQVRLDDFRGQGCSLRQHTGQDDAAGYVGCYNMFPLHLGMNVLSKMRLYFANKENMLYFTAAEAHK